MKKQESPFAVQIELAEGCNLRCKFCGLNGIRGKANDFKFMKTSTLASAIHQMVTEGWNPRIEFAMHGEPTMHPHYHDMIATARVNGPKYHLMMTSNGGGLLKKPGAIENIETLFDAGLNILALDDYQDVNIVPKICDELESKGCTIPVYEYPKDPKGNPHARRKPNDQLISIITDISKASKGNHSLLNNHAGSGAPKNDKQAGKRCAKPFRELSIRWDGSVAICCNDWRGQYKCGNVVTDGLEKVWNGPAMQSARKFLYHGQRTFGPCEGCDARSYRTGLLPDKLGKQTLPKPNPDDMLAVQRACLGKPYTAPVSRPWELKNDKRRDTERVGD